MRTPGERIKSQAQAEGFALSGIARAAETDGFARLQEWLARGYAGEMAYMERYAAARRHPSAVLPDVRSVVMVGMEYQNSVNRGQRTETRSPPAAAGGQGKVARYAAGPDYHDILRERLNRLLAWIQSEFPGVHGRGVVDTAPLLERDFARRAGLGWIGKNTMLINKHQGSYLFLGALLLDLELDPDPPHVADHCGTCTACLDACPTDAFAGPGWLDARKCISYLTIELRTPVPAELRPGMGDWLFGCDVCQEVCPWNRKDASEPELVDATELLSISETEFRERYRGTALDRTKRRGLVRNAALVLGNIGDAKALPALQRALDDPEPMVRDAAAWAIHQIEGSATGDFTDYNDFGE
jgi:epoxyqueuosine reductase